MNVPDYTFDQARLAALARYELPDGPSDAGFDDIVQLAAHICSAPVALVSLVDSDRQWFKARLGFEPCETDLNSSVCAHALVEPDLLVIPDLTLDPRSSENPLVVGDPHIRFYAGAPLRTADGHVLGSLCVIDGEPRPEGLTASQAEMLRALARQVVDHLELHRAVVERDRAFTLHTLTEMQRAESERDFRRLFDAIDDGFCIVEVKFEKATPIDYRFVEVNAAFAKQTGLVDAMGKWMRDLAPDHEQHWFDIYGRVALTGEAVRFENPAKALDDRWYEVHAFRVGDASKRQAGVLFNDISGRKSAESIRLKAEALQQTLNHELSHRMKNMFSMVQAIASQTLRSITEQEALAAFTKRLHVLSTAHDALIRQNWKSTEISGVVRSVLTTLAPLSRFDIDGPEIDLGPTATLAVSLLLHELSANAVKYGSLSNTVGRVALSWEIGRSETGNEILTMHWRETGGPPVKEPSRKGFGSKLIKTGLAGSGGVELRYEASGLEATFIAPLAQLQSS